MYLCDKPSNKIIKTSIYYILIYLLIPAVRVIFGGYSLLFFIILFFFGLIFEERKIFNEIIFAAIIIFLYISLYIYATNPSDLFRAAFSQTIFWIPLLISLFNNKSDDGALKKKTVNLILTCLIITTITTIIGLEISPMASRELATGKEELYDLYDYYSRNIGGYGFAYSLTLVIPTILYLYNRTRKIKYILIALLMLICIIKTQYTIAIILSFASLFLMFTNFKTKNTFLMLFFVMLVFIVFKKPVANFLLSIAYNTQSAMIANRFGEIANALLFDEASGGAGARVLLYFNSFNVFIKNPLLGTILNRRDFINIGQHSQNFDLLAYTGLVGFSFYVGIIIRTFSLLKLNIYDSKYRTCVIYTLVMFLLLGFINTTSFPELSIIVFLLASCSDAITGMTKVTMANPILL